MPPSYVCLVRLCQYHNCRHNLKVTTYLARLDKRNETENINIWYTLKPRLIPPAQDVPYAGSTTAVSQITRPPYTPLRTDKLTEASIGALDLRKPLKTLPSLDTRQVIPEDEQVD